MSDITLEQLLIAIETAGFPEAAAAVDGVTGSVDALTVSAERADVAVTGGAAGSGKGLMGGLASMKALIAGLGIYEAVKGFSSFQQQLELLRTQAGATQNEVEKMSSAIKGMDVGLGTNPVELAKSAYFFESAGIRQAKAYEGIKVAAMAAKIGVASLEETSKAAVAMMVAGFHNVHEAMGEMNAAVGSGAMRFEELNAGLTTGALATFKVLGLKFRDFGAMMAVMGDNMVTGAQAATRLRMGLMMLIDPSQKAQKAMEGIGLPWKQLSDDFRKPDGGLAMFKDLTSHLEGLSAGGKAHTLAEIFGGSRNSAAMLIMLTQLSRLEEKYKSQAKGAKNFDEEWKATTETLAQFISEIKTTADNALLGLGGAINWVVVQMKGLASAFQHGKIWAVALVTVLGTLAAMGGVVAGIAAVEFAVDGLTAAFETLNLLMMSPMFWPVFLAVALTMIVLKVKPVREAFVDAFHWIVQAGKDAFGWIKDHWPLVLAVLTGPIGLAAYFVATHLHKIAKVAEWLLGVLGSIFKGVFAVLTWPFRETFKIVKGIVTAIVHAVSWMVSQIGHLIGKVLGPLSGVGHFLGGLAGGASGILGDVGGFMGLAGGTPMVTQGGSFLVGEQGPELVILPRGAAVQPNHELGALAKALAGSSGTSGGDINITLEVDGRVLAKSVVRAGLEAQACR
jgi:TP901 family phage tail tape measure protein